MIQSQLSPMMRYHVETKREYPDCILFYRLGDFCEMFFGDAPTISKELEIALTGKDCGPDEHAPMCGVPYHAVESHLYRLIQRGYKVVIAEQVEDPKPAKGLAKREVIRMVTPGTIISVQALDETKNNYLMEIACMDGTYGISTAGITTRDFMVTEVDPDWELFNEINKLSPSEIICNNVFYVPGVDLEELKNRYHMAISTLDSRFSGDEPCRRVLREHFRVGHLSGLGLTDYGMGVAAVGAVMQHMYETQKNTLEHVTTIAPYSIGQFMAIDTSTRRNPELVETMREKQKWGALLWVPGKIKVAIGVRLLRSYIEQPLIHKDETTKRQEAVEELNMNYIPREEICEYPNPIYDLERLIGRVSYRTVNPRDLTALKSSLEMLPYIKRILGEFTGELLRSLAEELDSLQDICKLIGETILEDPLVTARESGIIKNGYNEEADKLRQAKTEGKDWLAELESKEKEKTGTKTLKVKFNKVFGYYFEVTNSPKDQVLDCLVYKQTLTNTGRLTTDELKRLEDITMGTEDKLVSLEYDLFCRVRDSIAVQVVHIQKTAKTAAGVDVLCSPSVVSTHRNYVKPMINERGAIQIKNGRHPVVEQMIRDDLFVANDTFLDNGKNRLSVVTGPNMAGKSTYMHQVALVVLMAQLGSFVPAQEADIGICDRIFIRVDASGNLASGQSTFMVEMTEVTDILRSATRNDLLVLDEIGEGTSTFDGLSIAWAVTEHISSTKLLGARTLLVTHYHELMKLEGTIAGVKNHCIAVKEQGDDIIFLRKIARGGVDKSYGIQVAKLAGVPDSVIVRTKEIAEELSDVDITARAKEIAKISPNITQHKAVPKPDEVDMQQLTFSDTVKDDDIVGELDCLELPTMTPIDAPNTLYQLQTKLKNRRKDS